MQISEFKAGELYAYNNRRCRMERFWSDGDGIAHAEIAIGRKFENSVEVSGSKWGNRADIRTITHTWEDHKNHKQKVQEDRQRADNLSLRLRNALAERDLYGWLAADGHMSVRGELNNLEQLISDLESLNNQGAKSALDKLFS